MAANIFYLTLMVFKKGWGEGGWNCDTKPWFLLSRQKEIHVYIGFPFKSNKDNRGQFPISIPTMTFFCEFRLSYDTKTIIYYTVTVIF